MSNDNASKRKALQTISVAGVFATIISLFGPNPLLCVPAFISLYFIIDFLFLSKYLTGFLLAFVYQWTQVSIKVIYACLSFKNVLELTQYPEHFISCYLLCSFGLILIVYAISIFLRQLDFDENTIEEVIESVNLKNLFISYFAIGVISSLFPASLNQLAIQLAAFKWGLFYIIFLRLYHSPRGKWIIIGLIILEFILGFASYFSSWKDVIFYATLSLLSVTKLTPRKIVGLCIGAVALLYLGLLWTGVKGEYRTYISQGNKQVVMVSKLDAYSKLIDLAGNFQLSDDIIKNFIDRVSYIDYFSACMNHVPAVVPHENGKLTTDAIQHVLVPRALNPNKAIIDESTHLTKYTGVFFSNLSMGVSFSLGYFGDFYVDYGTIGMLIAIFIYGLFIGFVFKNVFIHISNPLIGIAVLQMSFMLLQKFEISLIKLTGTIIMFWILYRILAAYVCPKYSRWLIKK